MSELTGWVPYDDRTGEGQRLTDKWLDEMGTLPYNSGDIPSRVIPEIQQKKYLGYVLPRNFQSTGSCVGSAAAQSYQAQAFWEWLNGDEEEVKMCFPWATYGVGRYIAFNGRGGKGEGSFGAAQAQAVSQSEFGMLPYDDPRFPQPTKNGNWWKWSRRDELDWSWSPQFPIPRGELSPKAKTYGIETTVRIRSVDEWIQAIANQKTITLASMYGTRPRVEKGLLVGRWNASWAHQIWSDGYLLESETEGLGDLLKGNNNWGPNAHGSCPLLSSVGCTGSFWIPRKDAERICKTGEVIAHSGTGGFESKEGLWLW